MQANHHGLMKVITFKYTSALMQLLESCKQNIMALHVPLIGCCCRHCFSLMFGR